MRDFDNGQVLLCHLKFFLVYQIPNQNVLIIQQRSLCIKGKQRIFSKTLLEWLRSVQCGHVVVLSGASTEDQELSARYASSAISISFFDRVGCYPQQKNIHHQQLCCRRRQVEGAR